MEAFAGFLAHTDHHIHRLLTSLEERGMLDNTLVFYIAGDNGTSGEGGQNGMFSEMTYFNGVPEKVEDMLKVLDQWGGPETYPHMAAGWAVALNSPFGWMKQVPSDYGGTRNGMVVSWPKGIKAKNQIRSQFSHVIDIAPTVLQAIATYERTLVTGDTPFDRWLRGDRRAMSDSARRGFAVFTGKGNCADCHSGWNFTDDAFHDIGLATQDVGRMAVSKTASDQFAFKTPTLREINARAPYMHNCAVQSLEAVIAHYITGGQKRPSLSPKMKPLALSGEDLQDLAAFLRALSSPQSTLAMPNLPAQ
jgi:arylsulfatase A-like enzyme